MSEPVTRAQIDLGAIAHNIRELRRLAQPDAMLNAVVKADGYGHGSVPVAKTALANGADRLAVARLCEAKKIREGGLDAPLLLFGYATPTVLRDYIEYDIIPSVGSIDLAQRLSAAAQKEGVRLKIHLKVDTGMGRLGFVSGALVAAPDDNKVLNDITAIAKLPNLEIEGIYTHFANADSRDKSHARGQFQIFDGLLTQIKGQGIEIPVRHAANSAANIEMPETHLDMVRPGISIYGLYPSDEVDRALIDLKPAMTLKSTVIQLKEVPAGFKVSYGSTFEAKRPSVIASVPVGYADGYSRLLSSNGFMLVNGQRAPIAGRVCMDITMINVTDIDGVQEGDEVVIFGKQNSAELPADELARNLGTINYEIVSAITSRVKRVYT